MYHHPHYPSTVSQQQDLYRGAEIVMIFVAIFGLWRYTVAPLWESVIILLWNCWQKSFNTKEKLILLALLALAGYLSWQIFLALIQLSMSYYNTMTDSSGLT
jgi:hypothetical protein